MTSATKVKRTRDPLSPKPILDRTILLNSLKSRGIVLKNGQLDLFYQLLHRSGYPPLHEFVGELHGEGAANTIDGDENCSLSANGSVASSSINNINQNKNPILAKNSISSRPGRLPQLPKAFLDFLYDVSCQCDTRDDETKFVSLTSKVQMHQTSADGTTTKIAVELQDGHVVESVLMRHEGRATLCVSSQVGCAMGCTFCATGTMGIRGNLCSGEILEQLVHASKILSLSHEVKQRLWESQMSELENGFGGKDEISLEIKFDERSDATNLTKPRTNSRKKLQKEKRMDLIRNIVFMGMGEPLNNYSNVLIACRAMIDRRTWNLAHNRVTVSTVGVVSRMRDLTRDLPEVNLALSLHAPNQAMREKIVPSAKGTPIKSLIEALDEHMMALTKRKAEASGVGFNLEERQTASKKKRAMIEYVMLVGDTSTIEAAHQLGKLCEGRHLVVNLIPYNKTDVKDKLSCPTEEHMLHFRDVVSSYGAFCTIRRTMGADIAGACGQLVVEQEKKQQKLVDIEDGPFSNIVERKAPSTSLSKRGKDKNYLSNENKANENVTIITRMDPWVRRLTIATAITATCFVASIASFVLQKRKR